MKTFNVGLIGMGTVGTGVAKILLDKDSPLLEKLDCVPVLKGIADCNPDVKSKLYFNQDDQRACKIQRCTRRSAKIGLCRERPHYGCGRHRLITQACNLSKGWLWCRY